jgi:serine/threonine protein kinase
MAQLTKIKGRYEIKGILGQGGMGVVYRAYDPPPMNRDVALKTLLQMPDQMSLQLFYKECEVLKSMSHPNIVEIFDMGEFDDGGHKKPYFVMPLLRGQPLDEIIRNSSHRLTVDRVVEIMSQTCRGLQAAHESGLIHRDLKPSNLFVMEDDAVKIIDFGVVHTVDARSRSSGFQKGTLLYMAPEQIQFKPVSAQSDIFSLGVVCYEALTRRQPFRGNSEEEIVNALLNYVPPPASELNPAVNNTISRVIHKAMAKQPWNRFETAREFGDTLQKALRNQPIEMFDPARIQPRIQRASKALESGDYQFAGEIVAELDAEGILDPQLTLLRTQIEQVIRQRTIAQLLESARARFEEEEDPLALQKVQEILKLDPNNVTALGFKSKIENRRNDRQIEKGLRLSWQHLQNHSYGAARDAVQNVIHLRPNEPRALRLLSDIDSGEKEYFERRQKKSQVYQAALNAWKNGEVSQALSHMGMVLELDGQAPDTSSPEATATYKNFYNQVRSEHDNLSNAYNEARRALAEQNYALALKICDQHLVRYPNQALFQAMKFDIEGQQRQQLSAFIADVDRRLEAEGDLDAKVNLLRQAQAAYPGEAHFERSLRLLSDKRDLVSSIVARCQAHDRQGQITEAISDLETLRTIYGQYPGLEPEIERLQKRRELRTRDAAKARWMDQIERHMEAGNYSRALESLQAARGDYAGDAELAELEKAARQGAERAAQAEQLLSTGFDLCQKGKFDEGIEYLRRARQLDSRNPGIRTALRDALLSQGQTLLETNWQAAGAAAEQALELDPSHVIARSLRSRALDRKRESEVNRRASQARHLQAEGNLQGAIAEVEAALRDFPNEEHFTSLRDTLKRELSQSRRVPEPLPNVYPQIEPARPQQAQRANTGKPQPIPETSPGYVPLNPEAPVLQTIAWGADVVENRTEDRRADRREDRREEQQEPPQYARQAAETVPPGQIAETPSSQSAKRLPLFNERTVIGLAAVVVVATIALITWRLYPKPVKPDYFPVAVEIHTQPAGASLRVNGEFRGTSDHPLSLLPGIYQIEASLPGYETSTTKVSVAAGSPTTLDLTLHPLVQLLRIAAPDLDGGQVYLDDNKAGSLENGSLTLPDIKAGQHSLRIADTPSGGQSATFTFQSTDQSIAVSPTLQVQQLQVVVVGAAGGKAQIISTLRIPVAVDGKPIGTLGTDALQVSGLSPGVHELVANDGKTQRKMSFEVGGAPSLDAIVFSDRDVGSALVIAGQDDADVFLDNKLFRRKTEHGRLRLPNLKTVEHTVRVHKDGYKDTPEKKIAIVKGQEARLDFTLEPLPRLATLLLDHLPPQARVLVDKTEVGLVTSDGTFSSNLTGGVHAVGVVAHGFQPKTVERKFSVGDTTRLTDSDFQLKSVPGILDVNVGQNAVWSVSQGNRSLYTLTGPRQVSLEQGTYTISVRNPSGRPTNLNVAVTAGETKSVNLAVTPNSLSMEHFQHPENWTQKDGWYVRHGGGFVLYDAPTGPGSFTFALRLNFSHGPFARTKFRWVIAFRDVQNYIEIQLDSKFLYRTDIVDGKAQDFPKVPHNIPSNSPSLNLIIDITPNTLVHRYTLQGDNWNTLASWDRNSPSLEKGRPFTDGKFGFLIPPDREIEVSNFSFSPKH